MKKSRAFRLFGIGAIPEDALSQALTEGVVISEEGISGSITFRNFHAPGRFHGWRRNWFSGSILLTRKHLLAFRFSKPIVGVAWDDEKIGHLKCSLLNETTLCFEFEAGLLNPDWSGILEVRFSTSRARSLLDQIEKLKKRYRGYFRH